MTTPTAATDDIVVLDSAGTPALSFAVPAALRLLQTQIDNIRQARPRLAVVNGGENGLSNQEKTDIQRA